MKINVYFCIINLSIAVSEAFFLFAEKEPIFLCFKICPLYCSPRRHDLDSSSLIYYDDEPPPSYQAQPHPPYYSHNPYEGYYVFCKPEPKSTTSKPTTTTMATTTEEPSWICMVCMDKCNIKKKKSK